MAGVGAPLNTRRRPPGLGNLMEYLEGNGGSSFSRRGLQGVAVLLSSVYGLGARARRWAYNRGWLTIRRLPAPVVSVGNLVVGGTGKTPVTACLARFFGDQGLKVAVLSRGYRGRLKGVVCLSDGERIYHKPPAVGEEAYWLARTLPGVIVYTAPCRFAAGMAAWQAHQPDLFLLDDGFQHFQLHRDLDIVLLDAKAPFGNGYLLPRGPLREPVSTLNPAQVLILTRFEEDRHQLVLKALREKFPDKPVLTAAIQPAGVGCYPEGRKAALDILRERPLWAFAGLARPQVFTDTLTELGVDLKGRAFFPDHYFFTKRDLMELVRAARASGAGGLITTSKDWARLGENWPGDLPLWVLEVEARWVQPPPDGVFDILR